MLSCQEDYQKAESLYAQVDEKSRDEQSQDASAGIYASLAALALVDKKAKNLLKEYP